MYTGYGFISVFLGILGFGVYNIQRSHCGGSYTEGSSILGSILRPTVYGNHLLGLYCSRFDWLEAKFWGDGGGGSSTLLWLELFER